MDKYDIIFCFDNIKKFIESFLKNRKELYKKYILRKKSWMMMEYYKLRMKRSSQYAKKHANNKK